MKVVLWTIGKTKDSYLKEGIALYQKRLRRYLSFGIEEIPDVRQGGKMGQDQLMEEEAKLIRQRLQTHDRLILLDEQGETMDSVGLSRLMERELQEVAGRLVFVVGGAFGFAPSLKAEAHRKLSLSKMTFNHQMVRLFFVEQVYRAMTIIRNEPYHHA